MGIQLGALLRQFDAASAAAAELAEAAIDHFEQHPDAEIITSFPGLGMLAGARVLAEIGDDRTRFADARGLKAFAGSAPITRASGKKTVVLHRHTKNRRLAAVGPIWAQGSLRAATTTPAAPPETGTTKPNDCAAPDYLRQHGTPAEPTDLQQHNCIVLRENEGDYALWRFGADNDETAIRVDGNLSSNDGDVITRWCADGHGLIMRSIWHVGPLLRDGTLVQVLADIPTPSADIHAVYLATAHLPRRIRELVNHLAAGLSARIET